MLFTKEQINQFLGTVESTEVEEVVKAHHDVLQATEIENEEQLKPIADRILTLGKGVIAGVVYNCSKLGLTMKRPLFRVYASTVAGSNVPDIKMLLTDIPSCEFRFKEEIRLVLDHRFEEEFLAFLDRVILKYVSFAIANEHAKALNDKLEEIKADMTEEGNAPAFDITFALHEKTVKSVSDNHIEFGTTYEEMFELSSKNSDLRLLFDNEGDLEYVKDAIVSSIKEDWSTSANALIFIRKHNKFLLPLVATNPNTRRTQRPDVLLRNAFTLELEGLQHRNKATAHHLETEGETKYISVYRKAGKNEEPVQTLPPVDTETLVFKG
ncbi:hypothetical protein ACQUY5_22260 [Bacillus cereus]|uniref:hypothetical protein n=1 Tax=Bacillus cereus TaxID=1396 RepID=UPI003D180758